MDSDATAASAAPTDAPAASPRAKFAAASFSNLRAAAGEGRGEPLRIALADIDEDPDQPRTVFDDQELESMAESIRAHGVVQPVVVRPPVNGRYRLAFGARRLRASLIAGLADIPAVVRAVETDGFAAQVIENQQRAALRNSDLAAAVERLGGQGLTVREICAVAGLKEYQVAALRQVRHFPAELATRLDTSDVRAIYDLYRQWGKTPEEVLAALPEVGVFISITEARRIIGRITGRSTGSVVLDGQQASGRGREHPSAIGGMGPGIPQRGGVLGVPDPGRTGQGGGSLDTTPSRQARADSDASGGPVFTVATPDGRSGRLVVSERAPTRGKALVAYPTGLEEVDPTALRILSAL